MTMDRRTFLGASAAAAATGLSTAASAARRPVALEPPSAPVVIASGNGLSAVGHAHALITGGADCVDGVVQGVTLVEDDPNDQSVGYGGLPNERGIVQLDASVMHGPTHKAGCVAALEDIRNASQVALKVLRHTDHVLLAGAGARDFAIAMGFTPQDMLTPKARAAWLRWRANLNPHDDWLDQDQTVAPAGPHAVAPVPHTWGTIHCAAVDVRGDISACTTTSGLSWKLHGRVGDSPIIGAGMFVDNAVGAAGGTGRGESAMQSCAAFQIVRNMSEGDAPTEACLRVLRWVADHTRRPDLLDDAGRPRFGLTLYALRKDGAFGAATMHRGADFCVHDGAGARREPCAWLYDAKNG